MCRCRVLCYRDVVINGNDISYVPTQHISFRAGETGGQDGHGHRRNRLPGEPGRRSRRQAAARAAAHRQADAGRQQRKKAEEAAARSRKWAKKKKEDVATRRKIDMVGSGGLAREKRGRCGKTSKAGGRLRSARRGSWRRGAARYTAILRA